MNNISNIIWFFSCGLGDSLIHLLYFLNICNKLKKPLYIYPYFIDTTEHGEILVNFGKGSDIFTKFFLLPDSIQQIYLKPMCNNTIYNITKVKTNYTNIAPIYNGLPNIIENNISLSSKFDQFDTEYDRLNEKYALHERIGVHLRLETKRHINYWIKILKKIKNSNNKFFIAYDSLYLYNKYIKNYVANLDIYTYPLKRAYNTIYTIQYIDYDKYNNYLPFFIKNQILSLKEAYFISKCKKIYYTKSSNFSNLIYLLHKIQKQKMKIIL